MIACLFRKRGWLDEENKVFIKYSLNNIEEDLNISRKTSGSLLKELEAIGLIEMVQKTGMANIIYVENFVSEGSQEMHKPGDSREPV
ncbi:MAG: replication initiator protein A [Mediterraneibacter gnavus]